MLFAVPDADPQPDLVAVMMPFAKEFDGVLSAIQAASARNGLKCLRADDIWEESTIIQDIFNLIFRAQIVVVDFTEKNPNVMYETGIAHTLGKHVIPSPNRWTMYRSTWDIIGPFGTSRIRRGSEN